MGKAAAASAGRSAVLWRYLVLLTAAHAIFSLGVHLGWNRGYRAGLAEGGGAPQTAAEGARAPTAPGDVGGAMAFAAPPRRQSNISVTNSTSLPLQAGETALPPLPPPPPANGTAPPLGVKDYLIVVSHFAEDPTWLQKWVPYDHVIYTHSVHADIPKFAATLRGVHKIPNQGKEASCYLKFIVDNYETLPEVVAFIHAHRKSWHHKDMVETLQYLSHVPEWGYMSLNDATKGGGGFKKGWKSANITRQTQKLACYTEDTKGPNKEARRNTYSDIKLLWGKVFAKYLGPLPPRIYNDCCGQFGVTRAAVHRLPKAFYAASFDWVMTSHLPGERSGRVFEQLWRYIFAAPGYEIPEENCLPC